MAKEKTKTSTKNAKLRLLMDNVVTSVMCGMQTAPQVETPETKVFRVSSMPYCSILHATNDTIRKEDYRSRFYTDIGTAMHELMQEWMGRSINGYRLFGNWKCRGCDKTKSMCVLPKECKTCAEKARNGKKRIPTPEESWNYEEIEVEYKGLTGHVDKLVKITGPGEEPAYMILDYKTTTLPDYEAAKEAKKAKKKKGKKLGSWTAANEVVPPNPALAIKYPVPYNIDQISAYCALLTKVLKLNIVGWSLVYVDRSNPISGKSNYHPVTHVWTKADQKLWIKRLDEACAAAPAAQKIFEMRCGLSKKKPTEADWLKVVKTRPCRTKDDFDAYMKSAFFYERDKTCVFLGSCLTCSDKALSEKLLKDRT